MCGVVGSFNFDLRKEEFFSMIEALNHRGPDGKGYYSDEIVNLGHTRLSIIDLVTGDQPIFNENKDIIVVFNGEIYNYKELRDELVNRGHTFRTNSDTEVLVHLYEEDGVEFLDKLNGIFAFAIYDKRHKNLILARDPVGVKPLYYMIHNGGIIFSSELKPFLKIKNLSLRFDFDSLPIYLEMEYYPAPLSPFRDIKKVLPGFFILCDSNGTIREKKFSSLNFKLVDEFNEKEVLEELKRRVFLSVERQLVSDVPIGIFLSGGVDSTIVALNASKIQKNFKTFTIGFQEKEFDESLYSREFANFLQSEHHEKVFSEDDMKNLVEKLLNKLDEPLADPSIFPTYALSNFSRNYIKVALGGDGGDELFCGYPTYLVYKYLKFYYFIPKFLRKNLLSLVDKILPVREGNLTFSYKVRKFIDGAEKEGLERHFAFMGAFNRERLRRLLGDFKLNFEFLNWIGSPPEKDNVTFAEWLDFHTYLMEDVLQKVDRMSMLNSLEVRVPLLDREIVNLAFSIQAKYKIKGFKLKHLLKKTFINEVPKGYFNRKKRGFAVPISKWIKNDLREYVKEILFSNVAKNLNMDSAYIEEIFEEHLKGKKDNRKLIFTLIVLFKWFENLKYEKS